MIEILETGIPNQLMVYVTVEERKVLERLFRIKQEAAIYYKQGYKIAYHWLLNPVTVQGLKLGLSVVRIRPE